jgi:hypothetical protein
MYLNEETDNYKRYYKVKIEKMSNHCLKLS